MGLFDLFKGKGKRLEDEKTWDESASNDDIEDDDSESLSVYDAALIWASNGKEKIIHLAIQRKSWKTLCAKYINIIRHKKSRQSSALTG